MNRLAQLVRDQLQDRTDSGFLDQQILSERAATRPGLTDVGDLPAAQKARLSPLVREVVPSPIVGTAYLELTPLPLHQQLYEFCLRVKAAGVERVKVVPIFLLRGVHVTADIPAEVALAKEKLEGRVQVDLCAHLGSHPHLAHLLKARMADAASEQCLLLAHGSRQPEGNYAVETLAETLGASVAFWSVPPTLETQVVQLMQTGCQRLTILPYFLFTGGITDAITRVTEELAERFPRINFRLLPPLGATVEVARLAAEIALNCSPKGAAVKPMKRVALRH